MQLVKAVSFSLPGIVSYKVTSFEVGLVHYWNMEPKCFDEFL